MISPPKFAVVFFAVPGFLLALCAVSPQTFADSHDTLHERVVLHDGWMLQSSCKVAAKGAQISLRGFRTDGWHTVTVPSTVVAALVADKTFPDPGFGLNLRSIPGTDYPVGKMFSVLPMPKDSPFRCSWWYRTEFRAPDGFDGQRVWLDFGGVQKCANSWVN